MPDFYPHRFIKNYWNEGGYIECVKLYGFTSAKSNLKYLVRVEIYPHKIYVLKFFPKNFSNSPNRYRLLTNHYEPRRIIYTCINILNELFINDPESSFAFIGSNSLKEEISNTKRYRVYKTIVTTRFGENTFVHFYNEEKSAYLLLRKTELDKNPNLLEDVEKYFSTIYNFSEL